MKILFINRFYAPDHSATSQMLTDLAVALARDGAGIHVITSRLRYDDPAALLPASEMLDGVAVHRVRTTRFGRSNLVGRALDYLSFYVAASAQLWKRARRGDVVVAKTDPPLIAVPVGWVARLRGAKVVNWLQDVFPEVAAELGMAVGRGTTGRLLRWLRDRSLRRAAVNVVLGRLMWQRVVKRGVDTRKVVVIPNWADGAALQPVAPEANRLRSEWGLGDKFVIGYSGNMGRAHELRTVVRAAADLRGRPEFVFLFIGGGAQQDALARESLSQGLANVRFVPYQPRDLLAQSLSAADVHLVSLLPELEGLVVPSKFYGIAAVGRPTIFIGDADGEVGRIVRAAECGYCVAPGDVAALVAAIVRLGHDAELRHRMGRNARRVFEERYDQPIAVQKWRALLRAVAEGGNPAEESEDASG